MAEFVPSISLTEFKKLRPEQLRRLKSCEVTFNTEYLFTFVNGALEPSGYLRKHTEYGCQAANAMAGKDLKDLIEEELCQV